MQRIRWILSIACLLVGLAKLFLNWGNYVSDVDKIIAYFFIFFGGVAIYYTTFKK